MPKKPFPSHPDHKKNRLNLIHELCAHAVANRKPLISPDTLRDDRCADIPLVVDKPRIRFDATPPVFHTHGRCLGMMCLMDTRSA